MVIFLVGLVSMILMRTLRKDYARYSKEEEMDDMVCFYWLSSLLLSTECKILCYNFWFSRCFLWVLENGGFCLSTSLFFPYTFFLWDLCLSDGQCTGFSVFQELLSYVPVTYTLWCTRANSKFLPILHFVTVHHQDRDLGDEYGWKQVHGDVFRPSSHPLIFSSLIGSGCQIFSVSLIVIIVAMVEDLYTEWVTGS